MDPAILKGLNHVKYENRKAAALDLDRLLRECASSQDPAQVNRIPVIMDQLCVLFTTPTNSQSTRNGGLLGLASGAIALGFDVVPYLPRIIPPILSCFQDTDSRMRYFGVECIYNIGKVVREELLLFFNEIFDDINKLSADSDLVVKNGAELLDRLLKDMVAESASTYVTQRPYHHPSPVNPDFASTTDVGGSLGDDTVLFSLERFIPLLKERIYVVSPHTRLHLTSWITVLDSVPELELVSYLPAFLDGLLKYLSDDSVDVRTATENVLTDFLREIRDIAKVKKQQAEESQAQVLANGGGPEEHSRRRLKRRESKTTMGSSTTNGGGAESEREKESWEDEEEADGFGRRDEDEDDEYGEEGEDWEGKGSGSWIPGQGVVVPYAEIVEILLRHVSYPNENIQSTALQWLSEFIIFAQDVMIPVTPSLLPQVLPYLAHPSPAIQAAATQTNLNIYRAILALPSPSPLPPTLPSHPTSDSLSSQLMASASISGLPASSSTASVPPSSIIRRDSAHTVAEDSSPPNNNLSSSASTIKPRTNSSTTTSSTGTATLAPTKPSLDTHISDSPLSTPTVSTEDKQLGFGKAVTPSASNTQPGTPAQLSFPSIGGEPPAQPPSTGAGPSPVEEDPFDYQQTVNVLTLQFLSDSEDTRVAALEWLLMLHQKAPKKILAIDDGTFPVLLKTLSDPAEEVIKRDLRLLAQISSSSEDSYFTSFMVNLLELFSTDRRLLETRGSLIIRQLCLNLNSERIYRTLAQILETEEDLEFAGSMVQKLNIILITSTELVDFRKRLKNLDSKDGQMLFSIIYRSWCHSPVAVFSLCLLAQAYEHASNLLQLFADLDTTLQLLVQIDKLVQLIESPVFTSLRLQLLEPEKYPYLFKCLYGLLMLLPQSTAFVSLRNRLSAVSSMGFLHIPKPTYTPNPTPRSKLSSPDEIKWRELLAHFRSVQARHEKARRSQQQQQSGGNTSSLYPSSNFGGGNDSTWSYEGGGMGGHQHQPSGSSRQTSVSSIPSSSTATARPAARRRFGGGGTVKEESSSPSSRIASANSSIKGFEVGGGGGGGGGRFPGMSPLNPRAGSARGASGGGGSASSSLVDALNAGGRASPVVGRSGGGAGMKRGTGSGSGGGLMGLGGTRR